MYRYVGVRDPLIEEAGARQGHDLMIAALFAEIHGLDEQWVETAYVSRTTLRKWAVGHMETLISLTLNQGNALRTFRRPYIIAAVYDIADSNENTVFYIAAETSHSGEEKDIDKATDNAKIIRAVTGLEAYPVVVTHGPLQWKDEAARYRLYEDAAQFVAASNPDAALWYRLDSAA